MKRGQSGLSLLLAVDKSEGMSSHDVVNSCRRVFEERRVGHTGTLDPLATGVLPICVGPATRLDKYMVGHDKRYLVTIGFGSETTTDDLAGEICAEKPVDAHLGDASFAESFVRSLVGNHEQLPPRYSAVKVNGVKSYEAARKGKPIELSFRTITIREASLDSVWVDSQTGILCWDAVFLVSKGTYIRSLARDIGKMLGTCAHVRALRRLSSGLLSVENAYSLETVSQIKEAAAIDPVAALGFRYAFADDFAKLVNCGNVLKADKLTLWEAPIQLGPMEHDCCTSAARRSDTVPWEGELISVVISNRLKAIYRFDAESSSWKSDCVFSVGVKRAS